MPLPNPELHAEDVWFSYHRAKPVLRGVCVRPRPGAVLSIIGPNGAGKTTLLRLLLGSRIPSRGRIDLGGVPVHKLPSARRAATLAYVPQRPASAFEFSARQVVRMGRHALEPSEVAVDQAMDRAGVMTLADEPFASLSTGQQQRVALARAMAQLWTRATADHPRYLLADEPLAAQDPAHWLLVREALTEQARAGVGVVVVVHDLALAQCWSHEVLVLAADGRHFGPDDPDVMLTDDRLGEVFGVRFARRTDQTLIPIGPMSRASAPPSPVR